MVIEEYFANMGNLRPEFAAKLWNATHLVCMYQGRQFRESGESYLDHLFDTSHQIYDIMPDQEHAVVGEIMHDLPEDAEDFEPKVIFETFGFNEFGFVMALSKKPKELFKTKDDRLQEFHERWIEYATVMDWTVIPGKAADRLHNQMTLHGLRKDPGKQLRVSKETLDFYVPFLRCEAKKIVPVKYHTWLDSTAVKMENLALAYLDGNSTSTFIFSIPA